MRYFYEKPVSTRKRYGVSTNFNHKMYNRGTLFRIGDDGLVIVQQRFNPDSKTIYWDEIDPWLANDIYLSDGFLEFFKRNACKEVHGIYPTFPVRKVMWALRMKPLRKEFWEDPF